MGLEVINLNSFSERLKELRESKGLTMVDLSRKIGSISQGSLSHYEAGTRKPGLEILMELAYFFNCSMDYLAGRTDYKNQEELLKKYPIKRKDVLEIIQGIEIYEESGLSVKEAKRLYEIINIIRNI